MATNFENGEDDPSSTEDGWSDADREAAKAVKQKCGIALVPDGIDD